MTLAEALQNVANALRDLQRVCAEYERLDIAQRAMTDRTWYSDSARKEAQRR